MKYSPEDIITRKILILDGAMGTMIQKQGLNEDSYRGSLFGDHPVPLKGNYDILNITSPDVIRKIHLDYLEAGADIISTNTFNANAVSQADYRMEDQVYRMNLEAARIAGKPFPA